MRKLFIAICAVLLIYWLINRNKAEPQKTTVEVEEDAELMTEAKPATLLKTLPSSTTIKTSQPSASAATPLKTTSTTPGDDSLPYDPNLKISDIDGSYTPPAFLTGTSARVATYVHTKDIIANAALKDIKAAFSRGIYLSKFIVDGLELPGNRWGFVHFHDFNRPQLELSMDLKINSATNPLQGVLSLKVNGVEKSCNTTKMGSLSNISMLSEENSVILVMSCDQSFYMQLYYSGKYDFEGNYYEKNENGSYQPTGIVLLSWKFND